MLDSNGSFDNPFFQDKKIVKIDCKWKGQEYSKMPLDLPMRNMSVLLF